jgi:hypothetical protein
MKEGAMMRFGWIVGWCVLLSGCGQQPLDVARNNYFISKAMYDDCLIDRDNSYYKCRAYRDMRDRDAVRFEALRKP